MLTCRLQGLLVAMCTLFFAGCSASPHGPGTAPIPQAAAPAESMLPHESFVLESCVLGETRSINVYTPPGYAEAGDTRFPVLYMPDGGIEEDFPHVTRTVDDAIRAGEMRAVIVVGIENTERRRDMTGPTEVAEDRSIAPRVGGSANFRAFIRDELMPVVNERVRGSGETGIIGESLAGLFIVETFLLEPALFDHYIALSPSLWWNGEALVRSASERLRAFPARPMTFFFTFASDDSIGEAAEGLAASLRAAAPASLSWSFEPMPLELHSTIYRAASPIALRKTFAPATPHTR